MKKAIFFIVAFLLTVNVSIAQIAFQDAVELKEYLRPSGANAFRFAQVPDNGYIKILKKYVDPAQQPNIKNAKDLHNYFSAKGNPFITKYLNSSGHPSQAGDPTVPTDNFSVSKSGGSIVTNIADGLAKFLVKRTKEELTVAFFDRFQEVFNRYPEFQLLFPNTHRNFDIIESFEFNRYLKTLRVDFFKDIDNLHINVAKLDSIICRPSDNNCVNRLAFYNSFYGSDNGYLLKTSLALIQELKEGTNPAEIINLIATNPDFNMLSDPQFSNVKGLVQLTDFISSSLKSTKDDRIWVSGNELNKLISDPHAIRIYLGLLFQQDNSNTITFQTSSGTKTFRDVLGSLVSDTAPIEKYLKKVAYDIDKIRTALDNIKNIKNSGNSPDSSDYYIFYDSILSLVTEISDVDPVLGQLRVTINHKSEIQKFLNLTNSAGNIYQDISSKNYSAVIMDLRILFEDLGLSSDRVFYGEFFKYGSFMAAIVEANDSDEVSDIIESFALPAGSSTIKKRTKFNVALNAYLGLAGGKEYNGDTGKTKDFGGIRAPIGISFSVGLRGKKAELGSLSLFASLVDLGAVTSFRFDDSETEELPEIELQNIFAPGGYLVYGLPKIPISVGVGFQYGPQLREVTAMELSINPNLNYSFGAFIAVDIPLLNFYTKSR